jgi:hypothetical protein
LFSGIAALIFGLRVAKSIPKHFNDLIVRLENRRVINLRDVSLDDFLQKIGKRGDFWARLIGLIAALGIALAFTDALVKEFYWPRILLGIGEVACAYVAGNYLGRMASHGQLGSFLKSNDIGLVVNPSHIDGVCGLKPVGDFYFFQAMVVAIPAIYLAFWWFLFPVWPRDYSYWEESYLGLMVIAFSIEILSFLLPLWSFHKIMVENKQVWQSKADDISYEIIELKKVLENLTSEDEKKNKLIQIEEKKQTYWAIENMVTWPVDIRTRNKFKFNNVLLLVPLIGDILKREVPWSKFLDIIKQFEG